MREVAFFWTVAFALLAWSTIEFRLLAIPKPKRRISLFVGIGTGSLVLIVVIVTHSAWHVISVGIPLALSMFALTRIGYSQEFLVTQGALRVRNRILHRRPELAERKAEDAIQLPDESPVLRRDTDCDDVA